MIEFSFIGWQKQDNHDKVWTSFKIEGAWYCAWGARSKKLQFKQHSTIDRKPTKLADLEFEKAKRYKEVDSFLLFTLFPDFEEKVKDELLLSLLKGTVK